MLLTFNGTFIAAFISFAIFILLMKLICYKPILQVMNKRDELCADNEKKVIEANSKRDSVVEETNKEISLAKLESSKKLKKALKETVEEKELVLQNKRGEAISSMEALKSSLEQEAKEVKSELKSEIKEYTKQAVAKILRINPNEIEVDEEKLNKVL